MIDLIKKTLLAGIGAAVITKEKIENRLEGFVQQGKLTAHEASETADRIVAEGREEFERSRHDLAVRMNELVAKAGLVQQDQWQALEARVKALEERMDSCCCNDPSGKCGGE